MIAKRQQIGVVEAREQLHARLFPNETLLGRDAESAVAGLRLWRAIPRPVQSYRDGEPLVPNDLGDIGKEASPRELYSTATVMLEKGEFAAWIDHLQPLTGPPGEAFISAIEAAAFLVCGAYLTKDDLAAAAFLTREVISAISNAEPTTGPVTVANWSVGWAAASKKLFAAHVENKITLLGRKAPAFNLPGQGDPVAISREFFAHGRVELGLFNGIYNRPEPNTEPATLWRDVMITTTEFLSAFGAPAEPMPSSRSARPRTHRPTPQNERDLRSWVNGKCEQGHVPTGPEYVERARQFGISRHDARTLHLKLPNDQRRERGGRGTTKHRAKLASVPRGKPPTDGAKSNSATKVGRRENPRCRTPGVDKGSYSKPARSRRPSVPSHASVATFGANPTKARSRRALHAASVFMLATSPSIAQQFHVLHPNGSSSGSLRQLSILVTRARSPAKARAPKWSIALRQRGSRSSSAPRVLAPRP